MKALLALRSVGFCVGQRQMCLNVRWAYFFFVFMQQKYLCHSVVCFVFFTMNGNGRVLAMVGHLKNVNSTFAQMFNRITNVEFTTVSPTIANTMLCVRAFVHSTMSYYYSY
jgi:hypothetical protein